MPIDNEIIDKLLKDYKSPEDVLGENGLLKRMCCINCFELQFISCGHSLDLTRFDGHPDNARWYARARRCSWQNRNDTLPMSSN